MNMSTTEEKIMPSKGSRWWLTSDSAELVINAVADRVYELVADLTRMGEWSPECERVEWEDGSTNAVEGATFIGHNRGGPAKKFRWKRHGRVLVADHGRELAFITDEGGRESTVWSYRLEPVAGGTRVTESYEVRWIPAWARIVDVPSNRHRELQEGMRHTLSQLKQAAEGIRS
jgi:uncharacterized protein YndB with AHSA1/START domain